MVVERMLFMSSSVPCGKYLLNLLTSSVGTVNTVLSAYSLMVINVWLGFLKQFKVSQVALESSFERYNLIE